MEKTDNDENEIQANVTSSTSNADELCIFWTVMRVREQTHVSLQIQSANFFYLDSVFFFFEIMKITFKPIQAQFCIRQLNEILYVAM